MLKKILALFILCLSASYCNADTLNNPVKALPSSGDTVDESLDNTSNDFPLIKLGGENNFPLIKNDTNSFFPANGASNFSPVENNAIDLPFDKGGISDILPPDAAFKFFTFLESQSVLVAYWQIAEGYYLYRNQFQFALKGGGILGKPQFPTGIIKDDMKFGRTEAYEQLLEIKLPIEDTQGLNSLTLEVTYQGCAEDRICYPPIKKLMTVALPNTAQPSSQIATKETKTEEKNQVNTDLLTTAIEERAENQVNTDLPITKNPPIEEPSIVTTLFNKLGNFFGFGKKDTEFLAADEAYVFSAQFPESSYLVLRWKIADGYYLYRDKFKFSLESDGELGNPQLPPSLLKKDPNFGDVQIYQQPVLEITVPIQAQGQKTVTLKAQYQGCAVAGFCHPPVTKIVELTLGKGGTLSELSEQDRLANLLANANIWYTLMVFFGLGLLLSLTPCVYPMIPILSGLIVGQGAKVTTYRAFIMSLVYVVAMALTYAVVGMLTGLLGENLQAAFQSPWILVSFALVFVVLSLSMFGFYELQLPSAWQTKLTIMSNRQQGGTLIGVAIMGVLSALIVGPCVAAPLVGALLYIAQTGDPWFGGLALFIMSLGMGVPLIIIGISAGHFLPKAEKWMNSVKAVFGVMLLAVAIWMLERIIPGQVTMLLWASLLIISAVYMGALNTLAADVSGWRKLWKGLGLILLLYGVLLMIGAASGHTNPLQPLHNFSVNNATTTASTSNVTQTPSFKLIKGLNELESELAAAKAQNKPVMLDFYADWCISCKEMEHFTFTNAGVQKLFTNFVLLKADVTPNDKQDKALYKHFGIFGPPAIMFFDTQGQEQRAYRVVGFMPAEKFRQHLTKVLQ
ncbi:protein-disulfide reductase DsbD [Candidatus Parabeggiatoa sp. HSG14]|uniref:protein-disulfide reductase DsbD n=1 Tax=Candidatus Parabeggiatoa sp. HSG14 TaxID=3055593 RepID=UPI0025A74BCC|nr:protein-disulfide reductase DsbD [Thiotrichales bacterium HSG14]